MRVLGYLNRYGQGVLRAQKALRDKGNAPAEIRPEANWFQVKIAARRTP
jgi:hypothetical protein